MSAQHLEVLETTVQKTHQWLDAISDRSHLDTHQSYQALRAVLQTLRDRLPANEAAHLAAQLPILVRGIFYEGWRPSDSPDSTDYSLFLQKITDKIVTPRSIDPEAIAKHVFGVMQDFLAEGELEKIRKILPKEFQELFK
jgi:uncharacterized protein (DUF2267 family)